MTPIDGDNDSYDEIDKKVCKIWCRADGYIHRDGDLPAVIWPDGSVEYYKDGDSHRDGDLPAVIQADGLVEYYKYGQLHRDGGNPAVIWNNGNVEYWVDGVWQ